MTEWEKVRVVTVKMMNYRVWQEVNVRETESQEEVQEVDSRDKVIHIENSEYAIFEEEQAGALGGQARFYLNDNWHAWEFQLH